MRPTQARQETFGIPARSREIAFQKIRQIHLVHDHDEMPDSKHAEQIGVPPALFAHAFVGADHQDGGVGARRAGDHVLQEFLVSRRVDDDVFASRRSKRNLGRVDRDVLILLFEQRVEQKSEFKFHSLRRARFLHHLDLAFRERIGVVQNPTD